MGAVLNFASALETEICCTCGIEFAFPREVVARRRGDKRTFYCPNGHSQSYTGESDEAKIERLERERQKARDAQFAAEEKANRERLKNKRLRKRISAGVCPCCHRSFRQLASHMAKKHPTYAKAEIA